MRQQRDFDADGAIVIAPALQDPRSVREKLRSAPELHPAHSERDHDPAEQLGSNAKTTGLGGTLVARMALENSDRRVLERTGTAW
jgi:hypothetical protein